MVEPTFRFLRWKSARSRSGVKVGGPWVTTLWLSNMSSIFVTFDRGGLEIPNAKVQRTHFQNRKELDAHPMKYFSKRPKAFPYFGKHIGNRRGHVVHSTP